MACESEKCQNRVSLPLLLQIRCFIRIPFVALFDGYMSNKLIGVRQRDS